MSFSQKQKKIELVVRPGQGALLLLLLESALEPDTILLMTMLSTSDTWVTQVMELAWMAFR